MQAPIPTSHNTHTHMLGSHASFHLIPMFSWSSSGETLISLHTRIVYPLDVPLTGVARRSSLQHLRIPSRDYYDYLLNWRNQRSLLEELNWHSTNWTLPTSETRKDSIPS